MSEHQSSHHKGYLGQLETTLDLYFHKKAPAIPKGGKDFIVMIAPWMVIIGIALSIPALFGIFGLGAMMSASQLGAAMGMALGPAYYASLVLLVIIVVLDIMALPGLFAKTKRGWDLIFYSSLVSLVSSLVTMNIAGFIIGGLISFYLLFQVREYYK
jgi:hypothetical protein